MGFFLCNTVGNLQFLTLQKSVTNSFLMQGSKYVVLTTFSFLLFFYFFNYYYLLFLLFFFFLFFYFTILYRFCHTSTCIRHGCTHVHHFFHMKCLELHIPSLGPVNIFLKRLVKCDFVFGFDSVLSG